MYYYWIEKKDKERKRLLLAIERGFQCTRACLLLIIYANGISVQSFVSRLFIADSVAQGEVEVANTVTLSVDYIYYY